MANILENFNENQLELIVDNDGSPYVYSSVDGDYIRMSVFTPDDTILYQFYSNRDTNGNYSDDNSTSQIVV